VLPPKLLVYAFQIYYLPALFSVNFIHLWVEKATDFLVIVLQGLKYQKGWDDQENFRISLFKLLGKLLVLFSSSFNYLAKV